MRVSPFVALATAVISCVHGWAMPQFFDGYMQVATDTTPIQMRIAYAGDDAMVVSWNTKDKLRRPTVSWGSNKRLRNKASSDVSITYPTSLTHNNHVLIKGLKPNTKYYWLPQFSTAKEPYSFTTARRSGDVTPFTVAHLVDMGTFGALGLSSYEPNDTSPLAVNEQTTIQSISKELSSFDFAWHPGDIAYADYWLKEEIAGYLPNTTIADGYQVYEKILNAFFDEMVNITSYKPYMVGPGNHEANCDNGGYKQYDSSICVPGQTNFTGYKNHWRMPQTGTGVENFWYSFDHGMTHFVQIDTETDLGHGLTGPDEDFPAGPFGLLNAQIDWLKEDLASVDRKKTPWIVVSGHRPFYLSADGTCDNCSAVFEPIFHEYGVDLYLSGHAHLYERMAPMYKNKTDPNELNNPKFTWYITNGAAGHYDGLDTFNDVLMPYSRYAEDSFYSWGKLIFHNCTHLTYQAISSNNSAVYDEATLYKHRECPKPYAGGYGGSGWGHWW